MDRQIAEQELAFVKKVIADSRKLLIYDGKDMIVWGILVTIGMVLMYVKFQIGIGLPAYLAWILLIGAGWIFSVWRGMKLRKVHRVTTFSGKMMGTIWLACGICMTIVGFGFTSSGIIGGWAINPVMSLFMGLAYFTSATVLGMRYMYVAGLIWWLAAIIMAFWSGPYTFLIFASLIIAFHIVPGVIFYKKWKIEYKPDSIMVPE
jgi:hypothetical protein